ncbi:MAG: hypothetical protein WCK32_09520 [Chlorobiaceae bacterium]
MTEYRNEQFQRLYAILTLIDNSKIEDAIEKLRAEIVPIDDISDPVEKAYMKRSNYFLGGAIKYLQQAKYSVKPALNPYVKDEYESKITSSEYMEWANMRVVRGCIQTIMQQGGWHPETANIHSLNNSIESKFNNLQVQMLKGFASITQNLLEDEQEKGEWGDTINDDVLKIVYSHKKGSDWPDLVHHEIDTVFLPSTTEAGAVDHFCSAYDIPDQKAALLSAYKRYRRREKDESGVRRKRRQK